MMKDTTRAAIDAILAKVGDNEFSMDDVVGISWRTFVKYVKVNRIPHYQYTPISLDEAVAILNDATAGDIYDFSTWYMVKDNTIVEVTELAPTFIIKK